MYFPAFSGKLSEESLMERNLMWNFLKLFKAFFFFFRITSWNLVILFFIYTWIKDLVYLVLLQLYRAFEEICLISLKIIILFHDVFKEDLYVSTTAHLHSKAVSLLLPHCWGIGDADQWLEEKKTKPKHCICVFLLRLRLKIRLAKFWKEEETISAQQRGRGSPG